MDPFVMGMNKYRAAALCDLAGKHNISHLAPIDVVGKVGGLLQAQLEYRAADIQHVEKDTQDCANQIRKSNPQMNENQIMRKCDKRLESETQAELNRKREYGDITGSEKKNADLKRSYNQRGDNSPASKGPGGVLDKQFPISGYENYSQCVEGMINDLSIDRSRAETECATHFGGAETSSDVGKKTANRKTYPTMKTSKTIQVHNANRRDVLMDSIAIGQGAKAKDGSDIEPEVPAWSQTMIGGPPNLIKSSSHIKSAKEEKENAINNYIRFHETQHRDSINYVERDPMMEKLIHEHSEYKADIAEILENRKIKSGKVEKPKDRYSDLPFWAIALDLI
jgi:hypothetical protein